MPSRRSRQPRNTDYFENAIDYLSNNPSPQAALWAHKSGPDRTHSVFMGAGPGGQLIWGPPSTHLLSIGPPQGHVGKSGAFAGPNAVVHYGPEVVVTTKWDAVRNVALPRLRVGGGVAPWKYDPTGAPEPGFQELRWSPLTECTTDAESAQIVDTLLAAAVARNRVSGSSADESAHWAELAKPLCHGLIRYANAHVDPVTTKPLNMRWIGEQLQIKNYEGLKVVVEWLMSVDSSVWGAVAGYVDHGEGGREIHSVFTTAQIIFEPWMTPEAIASMTDPNFSPADFVVGHGWRQVNAWLVDPDLYSDPSHGGFLLAQQGILPRTGIFESVIVSIRHDLQQIAAPLIITLLSAITRAAIIQRGLDDRAGLFGRPNVGLVLDELANLAPLPVLPQLLSEGASQGVTVYGCLQTASQSLHLWGPNQGGHAMLSNFGNVVLLPGVTDPYTLDWFEQMGGRFDRRTYNESIDHQGHVGRSTGWDRPERFPRDVLRGGHPQSPDLAVMVQGGRAMDWGYCTPMHRARPWVPLLLETFEFVIWDDHIADRPAAALLPAPDLDRHGNGQHLTADQQRRFWAAMHHRDDILASLQSSDTANENLERAAS